MKFFSNSLAILFAFSLATLSLANDVQSLSLDKLNALADNFAKSLKSIEAKGGAVCVVRSGKTIFGKEIGSDVVNKIRYPLGETSRALVSLMLVAMEDDGKAARDWKVSRHCSYIGDDFNATFSDLLSMRAGVDPRADSLLPRDADSYEVFSISKQFPPVAHSGEFYAPSRLSAALAGYALGYVFDKREKNMKKSFAACAQNYLFKPLDFSEPRFSSFNSSLFPATAFAFSIADIAKWLECETSPSPKISKSSVIARRRVSSDSRVKFSNGWLASFESDTSFQVSAHYWENCANVVAIFPEHAIAVAFLARSKKAKEASKLCADSLSKFIEILKHSKK